MGAVLGLTAVVLASCRGSPLTRTLSPIFSIFASLSLCVCEPLTEQPQVLITQFTIKNIQNLVHSVFRWNRLEPTLLVFSRESSSRAQNPTAAFSLFRKAEVISWLDLTTTKSECVCVGGLLL